MILSGITHPISGEKGEVRVHLWYEPVTEPRGQNRPRYTKCMIHFGACHEPDVPQGGKPRKAPPTFCWTVPCGAYLAANVPPDIFSREIGRKVAFTHAVDALAHAICFVSGPYGPEEIAELRKRERVLRTELWRAFWLQSLPSGEGAPEGDPFDFEKMASDIVTEWALGREPNLVTKIAAALQRVADGGST